MASRLSRLWARLHKPAADEPVVHPLEHPTYHDIVWENAIEAFQDSPDEIEPPDESGYPPVDPVFDLPPLEFSQYDRDRLKATKAELMLKAARIKREQEAAIDAAKVRRRWRRQWAVVAASSFIALGIGTAGPLAGQGIDAVDQWLNRLTNGEHETSGGSGGRFLPQLLDGHVVDLSERIDIPWNGTSATGQLAAYVDRGENVCIAVADPPTLDGPRTGSGHGCMPPDTIGERLFRQVVLPIGTRLGPTTLVVGFAAVEVESIEMTSRYGPSLVRLGRPWTPDIEGAKPFRLFAGVVYPPGDSPETIQAHADSLEDFTQYDIKAWVAPGHRLIDVHP
jgi:hypothetical protein